MFEVQETPTPEVLLEDGTKTYSLITLKDECGRIAHIIQDNQYFVLVLPCTKCTNGRYYMTKYWFIEAAQALANYMLETGKLKVDTRQPGSWSSKESWWKRFLRGIQNFFDFQ